MNATTAHNSHTKSDFYDSRVRHNPRYVPGDRVVLREPETKATAGWIWHVYDVEVDRKPNANASGYSYFYVYRIHTQGYKGKSGTTYRDVRGSVIRSVHSSK